MEIILKVIIYWDVAMWVMGAVFTTALLIIGLMWVYSTLFKGWGKRVGQELLFHLWVYQAMRAWEQDGNPRPVGQTLPEGEKLKRCARELIHFAEEHDYVLTIHTEPAPFTPLAMGNSLMVYEVRESSERYRKGGCK